MTSYMELLYKAACSELRDILRSDYDCTMDYIAHLRSVHIHMMNELQSVGRKDPNAAIEWWGCV